MWDIILAAAVGAVTSIGPWGLRNVWTKREKRLAARQHYVATLLDARLVEDIDNVTEERFDLAAFVTVARDIPEASTAEDIEMNGDLSAIRKAVTQQIYSLFQLRVDENVARRWFSSRYDDEVAAFRSRLIRWSRGRLRLARVYRPLHDETHPANGPRSDGH